MKSKSASPTRLRPAARLATGLSLMLLAQVPAWAQVPGTGPVTKVNGSWSANTPTSSWTTLGNYNQSNALIATAVAVRGTVAPNVNRITSINLSSNGAGYMVAPTVAITGGGGTGATAVAVLSNDGRGRVERIDITNAGANYTSVPTVTLSGPPPVVGGVGSAVHFYTDIGQTNTINLDGVRTVGQMIIGDLGPSNSYVLAAGTGGVLTFDNGADGSGSFINKFLGVTDTISAPVVMADQLNVRITTSRLNITGPITGNGNTLTSYGNGLLSLTGNNTGSNFNLAVWNRGTTNTNAQVELGATTGNAVGGNITVGNASRGTSGHAVLQLLQGRSNLDQISDTATVMFDSYSGSGRNNYFKLMGGNETVGRLLDIGSLAVIENREGEGVNTAAKLTIAGNQDSYVSGFIRDNSGNNQQQADADGSFGTRGLELVKNGTGTLTLTGGNIIFTGGFTVGAGTAVLRQTTNFRSNVTNNGKLVFDNTGTWNFTKTFADPDGAGVLRAPIPQDLIVSGPGDVEKTGNGVFRLGGNATSNQNIQGSFTVSNGTLNFMGAGSGAGAKIGKGLIITGDSGLSRNVNLQGRTTIEGGINGVGRFNNNGSILRVTGAIINNGDQEVSQAVNGVSTITGAINLNYMDLRLESGISTAKTSTGSSSGPNVTVTNSSGLVVGMRVSSSSGGVNIPAGTFIQSINPVTRVVTLSNNVTIPNASALVFDYADHGDGIINEFSASLPAATTSMAKDATTMTLGSSPAATGLKVGMRIDHPALPKGTTILSINEATNQITLSNAATVAINSASPAASAHGLTGINISGRASPIAATIVNSGGLYLTNSQFSNNPDRIPNSTPINMRGGVIELINNAANATNFSEQLGALNLIQGQSQVANYQAASNGTSTLRFSSLNRSPGATIEFVGKETNSTDNWAVTNSLGTNTRNQILVDGGVTMDDGIIGGWAWANNEFVKYGAFGVTRLTASDYVTTLDTAAGGGQTLWGFDKNVKLTLAATSNTLTLSNRRAVNSLSIQPDLSPTGASGRGLTLGSNLLSIESGGILASHGGHTITGTGNTGYVTVGTAFNTPGELIVITGTNDKSGTGFASLTLNTAVRDFELTFNGSANATATMPVDSFTMSVPVNTATVLKVGMRVNHANLPAGTTITAVNQTASGATTITLSNKPISGTLTASSTAPVSFLGGSVGLTKAGPGVLVMTSSLENTYTGPTIINNGTLRLRFQTNLGPAPAVAKSDHLRLNGGILQFGRDAIGGVVNAEVPNHVYSISDANRGITFGEAGGRFEVGHLNPNPNTRVSGATVPIVETTIESPIDAYGIVELAVRSGTTLDTVNGGTKDALNILRLGKDTSTNQYRGGIKTEGQFNGQIYIKGNNYINGLLVEAGQVDVEGHNNFSGALRVIGGALNLKNANDYNGQPNFTDTVTIGAGILRLQHAAALGTNGFKVNMTDGSLLELQGTNQKITSLAGTAGASIANGFQVPEGSPGVTSTLTLDLPVNETYAGRLRNGGTISKLALTKTGEGRLALTNDESDFSGDIKILGGVIDTISMNFSGGQSALGLGTEGKASEILIDSGALSFSPRGQQFTNRSFTMGAGANAATLVANGLNQAARVIIGADYTIAPGDLNFESRIRSEPVGFANNGARTLTLGGVNTGDNAFQLQLGDKSAAEPTSLMKTGPGTWLMGLGSNYSGQTTVQEGVLAIGSNNAAGTNATLTSVDLVANSFVGNLPNNLEVVFVSFFDSVFPNGLEQNVRYFVVASTGSTFKIAKTRNGTAVDITPKQIYNPGTGLPLDIPPVNVRYVPIFQTVATTVGKAKVGTTPQNTIPGYFTGLLPNGALVSFSFGIPIRTAVANAAPAATLPGGVSATETYYVRNSDGDTGTFNISKTPTGDLVEITTDSTGSIYYTATVNSNNTQGINVIGGRLELRNVDYATPETLTFQGGAMSVPASTQARWAGNIDVQANTTFTVGADSELVLDGSLLGNRSITQLGEGTIRLSGETVTMTQPSAVPTTGEMDNNRRNWTLQAGTLILDYTKNNNSKLVDNATFVIGGGRRGGILRLDGGNHEEIVAALSLQAGANQIFRDSGTSTIRLNTISRAEGSSLYFDLARIATVDNLNVNNILGGWAIIRDAVSQATWMITGTVSRSFTVTPAADLFDTGSGAGHLLPNGAAVRFSSTGTLPAPLQANTTYYVISAANRTFKVSAQPNGAPVDITSTGTPTHTVATFQPGRPGPATLIFTANADNYAGELGNGLFSVQIVNSGAPGEITSTITVPSQLSPATPLVYKIITTTDESSAALIENFVNNLDPTIAGYLTVRASGNDATPDTNSYGPTLLGNGSNDNGSQELGWARNGSNSADSLVQVNSNYLANTWSRNFNVNVTGSSPRVDGGAAYTLRYAASTFADVLLEKNEANPKGHTLQTGSILISPTVGANDSLLSGPGSLTTENEGNLRNFLIHQYNQLGDFVISANLVNRQPVVKRGRLTSGNRRILSGLPTTTGLQVGALVGPTSVGIPTGTKITRIFEDGHTVEVDTITTGGDRRDELTFTMGSTIIRRFATQQAAGTQNRINGVFNPVAGQPNSGVISTGDIYLGMPISGPGIPVNATVDAIFNESDIRINTNHFFNAEVDGFDSTFTLLPTVGLEKLGGGTLILSGDNTYAGVTFLGDGVLRAQKLVDAGVAGSLGISSNAVDNLVFNGGTLQYIGENTSTNRGFRITDFATINVGHEKTTATFNGAIVTSGTLGASDRLEKTGSGMLEMLGNANINELKVTEGKLRIQTTDTNFSPGGFSPSNFGQAPLTILRVSGGILEVRGAPEGNISQTFAGGFFVDEGASEIRAVSVAGYAPDNLRAGVQPRSTTINLMGGEETTSVVRSAGGTVRFVEEPELNSLFASIVLNTFTFDRAQVLPWAVYQDTTNQVNPGVNNFASVSLTNAAVVSADSQGLYDLGDNLMNPLLWGSDEAGPSLNVSEGGRFEVVIPQGVTAVAGDSVLKVDAAQETQFKKLLLGMTVSGTGIPAGTKIVAIDLDEFELTLSQGATTGQTTGPYVFSKLRSFSGRVGLVDSGTPDPDGVLAALGVDREVNVMRYFNPEDSTITVDAGSTLKLASGAILIGANVHGANKQILGPGNITGFAPSINGNDILIHNYNAGAAFTIGANVVDNVQRLVLVDATGNTVGLGSVSSGSNVMAVSESAFDVIGKITPGMEVTGPHLPDGTFVTAVVKDRYQILLSKAATGTTQGSDNPIYSFRSITNFVQSGIGTTILSGNNLYTGTTFVHGGVLRLDSANAIPGGIATGGSATNSSHIIVKDGVIGLGSGNFTRNLGTGDNQVEFKGSGGFAAYGADRVVDFGGLGASKRLRFGNEGFVLDGSSLILGAHDATHKVTIANSIDLGSFSQAVRVENGPADIEGELGGSLSGLGKLIKFGRGSLRLAGQNSHGGGIEVAEGRLVLANVPNVLGTGTGGLALGISNTNTSKNAVVEVKVEGGTLDKNIEVGNVNSRGGDWIAQGQVDANAALADLGTHSSMASVNGNPAIAYYDATSKDLKYVRAADARGNSWLPPVTLASLGDVGQFPSLAVINGNPAVTYYDATNGTLCYVRATDISGVIWNAPIIADANPVNALAIQADGKIVAGGTFVEFDGDATARTRLVRLGTGGTVDSSFNASVNGEVRSIVVQGDGKIIIAGAFTKVNGTDRNNIARLESNGTLDGTFNPNANAAVRTLVLQPDGKLLVGGAFTSIGGQGRARIARLNTAATPGTADSFNPGINSGEVRVIVVQTDGSVIIGGSFTDTAGQTRNRISRVDSAGALQAFNPNASSDVRAIVVDASGKIYIGGLFTTVQGTPASTTYVRSRLSRLMPDGSVDTTYSIEVNGEVRDMELLSSGKIALVGTFTTVGITSAPLLARLNADGSVDTAYTPNPDYEVRDLVQQADGKLVTGGVFSNIGGSTQHWVGRLNDDGTADSGYLRKVDNRGQHTSLAFVNGNPGVSYYDVAKGDLFFTRSTDANGTNWVENVLLDGSANNVGKSSSLDIGNIGGDIITKLPATNSVKIDGVANYGTPVVAYIDDTSHTLKYIVANNVNGTDWSAPVPVTTGIGNHVSLEIVNGIPAIAYTTSAGALNYVYATNVGGITNNLRENGVQVDKAIPALVYGPAWGTPKVLDTAPSQFPVLSVVNGQPTTAAGTPAVAYVSGGLVKYLRATDASGEAVWGPSATIASSALASNVGLIMSNGVPGISYHELDSGANLKNLKFVHLTDAAGYTRMAFSDDTTLNGTTTLDGMAILSPGTGKTLTVNGSLAGVGGFRLASDGTMVVNSSDNQFGSGLSSGQGGVIIRSGNLVLNNGSAFGTGTDSSKIARINLGDRNTNVYNTPIINVVRTTNGTSVTAGGGTFNPNVDDGTFTAVSKRIDGVDFTSADVNKLILVKDEIENPARNGVYRIAHRGGAQPANTIDLVRIDSLDESFEFVYHLQVQVLVTPTGTENGAVYFLNSLEPVVNTSPILWTRFLVADRATNGDSLLRLGGRYDKTHNGRFSGAGGPGAFVEINTTLDGRTFSAADEGTLILVKDEQENPALNGLYMVRYNSGLQPDFTMNLVRVPDMDEASEFGFGTQVRVANGTSANKAFFVASTVADVNTSPVLWTEDIVNGELALRLNTSGQTLYNNIDINHRVGAGSMTLGTAGSLTSGTGSFEGAITLMNNQKTLAEVQTLNLSSNIGNGFGVEVKGVISEAHGVATVENNVDHPADVLSLVKTGTGVVTLRGNNTFHGGVTVNQGTLLVMNTTGSATGSGLVQVNAGGVLSGTGSIGGAVNLVGTGPEVANRATLRIGNQETLTISGPLTIGANSVVEFTLGAANMTRLAGSNVTLTETGRILVSLAPGFNPLVAAEFDLMDLTGSLSFSPLAPTDIGYYLKLPGAYIWDTSTFLANGKIRITGNTTPVAIALNGQPASVTVNPGPTITVNFTVTVTGSADFVYQWQRETGAGWVNIGTAVRSSSPTNTFSKTGIIEGDEGSYRVVVTNGEDSFTATSNPAVLTVNDPPTIVQQPTSKAAIPGTSVSFSVVISGPPTYTFVWRKGTTVINSVGRFTIVNNGGTSTLTIGNVEAADEASDYNVVVGNQAGTVLSNLVALDVADPVTFVTQPASVSVAAGDPAFFRVTASGTGPITYQWQRKLANEAGFSDLVGETGLTLRLPSMAATNTNDSVRVLVTNPVGTVTSNVATITVTNGGVSFLESPDSKTVLAGTNLTLTAKIGGSQAGRSVVWKRNNGAVRTGANVIGGVTSFISIVESTEDGALVSTLTIQNISTGLAGAFKVEAKNASFPKAVASPILGNITVVSNPNSVVPAQNTAKSITLSVVAIGPPKAAITYKWQKNGADIVPDLDITGVTTKTLTIKNVTTDDAGLYSCIVTGTGDAPDNQVEGGTQELRVYTAAPALLTNTFPPAMVGSDFTHQIAIDPAVSKTPELYKAAGLPAGLKLDAKSGKISGRPTKAGAYKITLTASNKFKPDAVSTPIDLEVKSIPAGAVGVFAGWLPRHELNDGVGGRFDLTTTATGTFTGKVTMGATVYPIKGSLDLKFAPGTDTLLPPAAEVSMPRKAVGGLVPPPFTLNFTLDPAQDRLATASVSTQVEREVDGEIVLETVSMPFTGWRNKWSKLLLPATAYMNNNGTTDNTDDKPGYHTFALSLPADASDSADVLPQGDSYASFSVAVDGKLSMVGKLADGQAITGAQFVGPAGEIVVFVPLYKTTPRGSLVGQITLDKGSELDFADNTISSSPATAPTWTCPANILPANRSYRDGFGPVSLNAVGGSYVDPTPIKDAPPKPLLLGIAAAGADKINLEFTLDGLTATDDPSLPYLTSTDAIDLSATNVVTVPKNVKDQPPVNPYLTTLSVAAKTGAFSGKVTLENVVAGKVLKRAVTYQGIIVKTGTGLRGFGYYVMPKLPGVGEVVTKTPLISNQVVLSPR